MTTPFHPLINTWFETRFGAPTDPQRLGWPEIAAGRHTLIAAPTGSGKTLSAFLVCIDRLFRQGLSAPLPDEVQVVYVSPLKALGNDIRRNLEGPLREIREAAAKSWQRAPDIRALVRSGDTPAHERAAMLRKPPHILVTTPESLYLLLTSEKSRNLLGGVNTVIVDEIHALARDKRGSHLALSLERLESLCAKPPVRIGLSATQKPLDDMARFLVGARRVDARGRPDCALVDVGHARRLDLAVEIPPDIGAVCSNKQWEEIDKRLAELISGHRSTLIFVNTRRMAERVSHRLRERLGESAVAGHHGSLSKEIRLSVEDRLKKGELKALVATASLELGIDIGFIDLVCQLGSPRSIAAFLQRVGRSGHRLGVVPKGRFFALTRDELLEGLALLRAVRMGRMDAVEMPAAPLDILAQQIVAEVSARDWDEDALYELFRGAWPFRDLARKDFDRMVSLLSEGVARGRREGAYLHRDAIHRRLRARRSARLSALTSGGAIPETADYRVVTEDDGAFVGTVNEDFAIESIAGDVFLLGNTSWRVRYVRGGQVVVRNAEGAPANVPFWLGEAPGRTPELSEELSRLREEISDRLSPDSDRARPEPSSLRERNEDPLRGNSFSVDSAFPVQKREADGSDSGFDHAVHWLQSETGAAESVARQAVEYVAAQKAAVGFVPTQSRILFERFFDESGGMQLVIHAPFGSRINRAWGLALRKRFCRTFDFELQASADDNGITLSLGPQHSFPVEEMFKMLRPGNAREVLVQALLAAPMFQVRWRWNLTRSLAVLRNRGGKKVPPPLQRFKSDDLLTAVFPAQTACFENRDPDVKIPDHPLVAQTIFDCLHEAMDVDRWEKLLAAIQSGAVKLEARDTREPSPFSHSILNANPYAFLDDAPLEERRARAVAVRRFVTAEDMKDLARLDPEAIERVRAEARPVVRDAEELHQTLLSLGAIPEREGESWTDWFDSLVAAGRAARVLRPGFSALWIAAERERMVRAVYPGAQVSPEPVLPEELRHAWDPADAVIALVRGRLEISGPVTAERIAEALGLPPPSVDGSLRRLETEGFVLQGRYSDPAATQTEWCERGLLARIHRHTLEGARRRVQPVSPEVFWNFLTEYHHLLPGTRRDGPIGLLEAVGQLQGFETAAGAWEPDLLSSRTEKYDPEHLDRLFHSGELVWGRLRPPKRPEETDEIFGGSLTRVVPISLTLREDFPWVLPPERGSIPSDNANALPLSRVRQTGTESFPESEKISEARKLKAEAQSVYGALRSHGALFFHDLEQITGLIPSRLEDALGELAALGLITADGFAAIRGLVRSRTSISGRTRRWGAPRSPAYVRAGRWSLFPGRVSSVVDEERRLRWAWQLLRRYGIVFRDLLSRETAAPAWWELTSVYRRLEARGELRGGRFVSGVAGEQYALPEAVETLRRPREGENVWVVLSAADPLNLTGVLSPIPRVPATRGNRILLHNGRPSAVLQGGEIRFLEDQPERLREKISRVLRLTQVPAVREALLKELVDSSPRTETSR